MILADRFPNFKLWMKRGTGLSLFLVLVCGGCSDSRQSDYAFQQFGETMGTTYSVKLPELPENLKKREIQQQVVEVLRNVNASMSTYDPRSELSTINQNQSNEWIPVSADLLRVLLQAEQISELSGGAFDVTVGGLVNLWGFGPDELKNRLPDDRQISERRRRSGFRKLSLRKDPPALRKTDNTLAIDLSALAKGFAVDRIAETLDGFGIRDYLIEVGGELRARGRKLDGKPWRIAIERPEVGKRAIETVIEPGDRAVATSGDYRNFYEVDNIRYSHTIDPLSGRPVEHALASVTVLDPLTIRADALATAFMVMGADKGFALAKKNRIPALFIIRDRNGFSVKTTESFPPAEE